MVVVKEKRRGVPTPPELLEQFGDLSPLDDSPDNSQLAAKLRRRGASALLMLLEGGVEVCRQVLQDLQRAAAAEILQMRQKLYIYIASQKPEGRW